jgi:hypothetical protein
MLPYCRNLFAENLCNAVEASQPNALKREAVDNLWAALRKLDALAARLAGVR